MEHGYDQWISLTLSSPNITLNFSVVRWMISLKYRNVLCFNCCMACYALDGHRYLVGFFRLHLCSLSTAFENVLPKQSMIEFSRCDHVHRKSSKWKYCLNTAHFRGPTFFFFRNIFDLLVLQKLCTYQMILWC